MARSAGLGGRPSATASPIAGLRPRREGTLHQLDDVGTRERVLASALPLFAEHGYAGTPVRAIAAAAGVNVATCVPLGNSRTLTW